MEEFYQSSHTQTLPPKKFMTLDANPRDKLLGFPKNHGKYALAYGGSWKKV